MHVTFSGAAREVTGSHHLLTVGSHTVALDCGLFQGHRTQAREKNVRLPFPAERLSAAILSHAHIDHAGRMPLLVKEGFEGTVWSTAATRDLCAIMLADSAHIQEKDAEFLRRRGRESVAPLYGTADIPPLMRRMVGVPYDKPFEVCPGVRATFVDAGHILGSASVVLECTEGSERKTLVFSGDIGRWSQPIIRDPQPPAVAADLVIMESTYGDRDHPPIEDMRHRLASIVKETAAKGGRVIVPAFAVGRTQDILYDLHALTLAREIPPIPVYIDSPLAVSATGVFASNPDVFDQSEHLIQDVADIFEFPQVHYVRDVNESKALNTQRGPMVVIAASGMAEAGRIQHHLANHASDPRNTVLIVGFQAEHTLGRRIVERRPMLRILGDEIPLRARVEVLNGYSAHGDRGELTKWLDAVREQGKRVPNVCLVHGEEPAQDALSTRLSARGYRVQAPAPGDVVRF